MNKELIICLDFDGTIVTHDFPKIGKLKPYAKEIINKLFQEGFFIIIWTCRYLPQELKSMKEFLDSTGIKYDTINENHPDISFQPVPKVFAHWYVDDRDLYCDEINWLDIYKKIHEKKLSATW